MSLPATMNGLFNGTAPSPDFNHLFAAHAQLPLLNDVKSQFDEYDCVLQIFHARVAQKSYGNEKRFISPPPCVYKVGEGWDVLREQYRQMLLSTDPALAAELAQNLLGMHVIAPHVQLGIQQMREEFFKHNPPAADRPQTPPAQLWVHDPFTLDFSKEDYCAAKNVYISDSEKLKYFKLAVRFTIHSTEIGMFPSERIKVISKPSKKKQSMKSTDSNYLCISSGKKVALFNRLRSQTVSTKYLHCEGQRFHASAKQWGAFAIHLVDIQKSPHESKNFHTLNGYIQYGSIIKLVDSCTGMTLPRLIVRKIDKNRVFVDDSIDEPAKVHDDNTHEVCDGASWTIISTEKVEYRFYQAMGPTFDAITPIPVVDDISFDNGLSEALTKPEADLILYLSGQNFSTAMKVWFGAFECRDGRSEQHADRMRSSRLPRHSSTPIPWIFDEALPDDSVEIPIYVVRNDGVIYSTAPHLHVPARLAS
ncbi:hypothetical protein M3Y99_01926200 [Aphelenchoides fujianensis]|nr:hypothetical protein M3Y99_01926200 [Aphelenchoides fujianensis]